MKMYKFIAKCGVSCSCQEDIEVGADSFEEAEAMAWEIAADVFNNYNVEPVDNE